MQQDKLKHSNVAWIGDIPTTWNVKKVKFDSKISSGDFLSKEDYIEDGEYAVIGANSEIGRYDKKNISQPVIVTGRVGTLGTVRIYENSWLSDNVLKIETRNDINFVKYSLLSSKLESLSTTTAQPLITSTKLGNVKIPLPSISEQTKIASFLDKKCSNIDSIISDLERQIEILEKYKKSVITEAVTKGLNPDVEMKDSGINWIGEIPNHWDTTKMKFSSYMKGRIGWQGLTSKEYIDEGPYLVTGTDFNNGTINWESCVHVAEDRYKIAPEIMLKEFDLLITKDGTVGKVAIVNNLPDKATLNSGVLLIRPMVNIYEIKYLYYVLISKQFWNWFEWINNGGTTIIHLYQNVFSNFDFTLPPIEEQKQIINLLDKKVIEIDSIIEDKKQQVETIKKHKNSLIYEYVTGKKRVSQGDVNE